MSSDPNPEQERQLPKAAKKPLPLWAALAIALGLILLPGLVVGPLHAPFIVLWALCALALSFKSEFAQVRKQRLRNLAIYLVAGVLTLIIYGHRIDAAQTRGETLVSAIKAYRAENKTYPASLEVLVPKYIDRIPVAAYGRYYYHLNPAKDGPFFFFVTIPPFGRRGFCFDEVAECVGNLGGIAAKDGWYDFD